MLSTMLAPLACYMPFVLLTLFPVFLLLLRIIFNNILLALQTASTSCEGSSDSKDIPNAFSPQAAYPHPQSLSLIVPLSHID